MYLRVSSVRLRDPGLFRAKLEFYVANFHAHFPATQHVEVAECLVTVKKVGHQIFDFLTMTLLNVPSR